MKDKVVVVTGGSRGIGFATVRAFLKEGAKVILCASREETATKAVEELKKEFNDASVEGIWPNLFDYDTVKEAIDKIVKDYGRIDVLINNAGMSDSKPFIDYTSEDFDKVMDLNLKSVYNCSRAVVDTMKEQGNGVILNTSSMVSIYGQPSGMAYPTSKFAVNGLTKSLARELGPLGIRVNAVAPGITNTDMMQAVPKEVIEPLIARIPLRRLGEAEDIANAFVFLASDKASYINGIVLSVDGAAQV
ncbi:MAG: 3-oxoacyl-ACP reductase family protein [Candidatus Saccharibacteria bacterium]|nr:3-oxoacyl-ACP reductase family protein [Candidatus Saccharibacteria bacterium]